MINTDIKKVYYKGNEVTSLYWGSNLLYSNEYKFNNTFSGIINSGISDSSISYYGDNGSVNFADKVDPITRSFEFEADDFKFCNGRRDSMFRIYNTISNIPLKASETSLAYKFQYLDDIKNIDISNLNKVNITDVAYMFYYCYAENINLGKWDMKNVTVIGKMFMNAYYLKNVTGTLTNIGANIDKKAIQNWLSLSDSPLTNASAMVFINGLAEVEDVENITFKSTTFDTLTEEQIALATSKGWSVISA